MFTAYINNPEGFVDLTFSDLAADGFTPGEAVELLAGNLPEHLPYPLTSVTVVNGTTFETVFYAL